MSADETEIEVNTSNEFGLSAGTNLPNHSISLAGRGAFIRPIRSQATFRTKQEAYRFAAWLTLMAEVHLPDELGNHTFEQVTEAIQST